MDEEVSELLNRSLTQIEDETTTTTHTQDEYEVVAQVPLLPPRPQIPRASPLSAEQWNSLQDMEGRIQDVDGVKQVIFRGGVSASLRNEVWKYLLGYYPWHSTREERQRIHETKNREYFNMKLQWRSMTSVQESHFSDYRERKSLIEKDVNRTDRTMPFYAGDDNPNLCVLSDILMTYVMYNFDLGYVQGMSDLLSPILCLMDNEVESFWCFVGFMDKVCNNFDMDQAGMKEQLQQLHTLLSFAEPELACYLNRHDSGNMFFCFRWLLVWFKREFSQDDIMRLWEHINDLSQHIELQWMLSKAEGIYHQITAASHLTDTVRVILGMKAVGDSVEHHDTSTTTVTSSVDEDSETHSSSLENVTVRPDLSEVAFERSIDLSYL
ncbi:TBC1 domain family member 15/17 [Carabus blaptoides fortunei]